VYKHAFAPKNAHPALHLPKHPLMSPRIVTYHKKGGEGRVGGGAVARSHLYPRDLLDNEEREGGRLWERKIESERERGRGRHRGRERERDRKTAAETEIKRERGCEREREEEREMRLEMDVSYI